MISNPVPWPNGNKVACAITFDVDTDNAVGAQTCTIPEGTAVGAGGSSQSCPCEAGFSGTLTPTCQNTGNWDTQTLTCTRMLRIT